MNFEADLLVDFVAVAEELSFRRASERLSIAQPWLSRRLRKLESQLGFQLFIRTTRHVQLTEKGRMLLPSAQLIARDIEATRTLLRSISEAQNQLLRFGMPFYGFFVRERGRLFDKFTEQYPKIRLDIELRNTASMIADLNNGTFDAICLTAHEGRVMVGLESLPICEGGIDIILAANDELANGKSVHIDQIRGRTMSTFARATHPDLYDELYGIFSDHVRLREYSDFSFSRRLKNGMITALPVWVPMPVNNIVRLPLSGSNMTLQFEIVRKRGRAVPALDRLWRFVKSHQRVKKT